MLPVVKLGKTHGSASSQPAFRLATLSEESMCSPVTKTSAHYPARRKDTDRDTDNQHYPERHDSQSTPFLMDPAEKVDEHAQKIVGVRMHMLQPAA
jgi:hypothetical protein